MGQMLDNLTIFELDYTPVLKLNQKGSSYCDSCGSPWPDIGDQHDGKADIVAGMGIVRYQI